MSEKKEGVLMTPNHPKWDLFANTLGNEGYCNFEGDEKITWECDGNLNKSAKLLSLEYPEIDIYNTLCFFRDNGGYCDCEVLFNVDGNKDKIKAVYDAKLKANG